MRMMPMKKMIKMMKTDEQMKQIANNCQQEQVMKTNDIRNNDQHGENN